MKKFSILALSLLALASVSAFAEPLENAGDVILSEKHVSINASTATIVRTADTPKVVKIEMPVAMGHRVCEETGYREVFGQHPSCGYHIEYRTIIRQVCVRTTQTANGNRVCVAWENRREIYPVNIMNSCFYQVPYCVRYGTSTQFENRTVKIVFRKAAKLTGSEQETFLLTGEQVSEYSSDADFTLSPLSTKKPYKMRNTDIFGDRIKVISLD